jgi:hypothetical protein
MDDLRRLHYVTEHYGQLQGLRLLPLSVPFVLSAVSQAAPRPLLTGTAFALLLAASVAASFPIGAYYVRRFGRAQPKRWQTGMATLVIAAAAFLWLEWLQETRPLPVSLPVVFVALLLARLGWAAGRLRAHYLWIAGACAVFAILPVLHVPMHARTVAFDLLIAGGLAVAAIGDHRVLLRALTMTTPNGNRPMRSAA